MLRRHTTERRIIRERIRMRMLPKGTLMRLGVRTLETRGDFFQMRLRMPAGWLPRSGLRLLLERVLMRRELPFKMRQDFFGR